MTSNRLPATALVLCSALAFSGCLVSFQDYPLAAGGASASSGAGTLGASGGINGGTDGGASGGSTSSSAGDGAVGGTNLGGTGDTAGNGGASVGQGASGGAMPMPPDSMIDDFEDGDAQILPNAGRDGAWFAANDGTMYGLQTPDVHGPIDPSALMPPRMMSTRALHITGTGFRIWGAYVGASFVGTGINAKAYDVSMYQGVQFYGKLGKSTATKTVRVAVRDYDTTFGCTGCGDHFGSDVTVGSSFELIQVPFSDLKQQGWGMPQADSFDAKRSYAVLFSWPPDVTFDLWVDDLSFY